MAKFRGWLPERLLMLAFDSAMVSETESPLEYSMCGSEGGGGAERFPARGWKWWRVRVSDCLRTEITVVVVVDLRGGCGKKKRV